MLYFTSVDILRWWYM